MGFIRQLAKQTQLCSSVHRLLRSLNPDSLILASCTLYLDIHRMQQSWNSFQEQSIHTLQEKFHLFGFSVVSSIIISVNHGKK
jgi:fumarate reductase subunit D